MTATEQTVTVVPLRPDHWSEVERIYAAGIATGHATFEAEPPSWEHFDQSRLADQRHVALSPDGGVVGWVAASATSSRAVYAGVVEHSVYVHPGMHGQGIGRRLLDALTASTEKAGIWTIQSGIFPENSASLRLHQSAGYRVVGTRERLGLMSHGPHAGRWRDVVMIERRSWAAGN